MGSNRNWEEEINEILRRERFDEQQPSRPGLLDRIGVFIQSRFSTPGRMATTGAVLLCASLLLAVFPVMRLIVPLTAAAGVVMLFVAYLSVIGFWKRGRSRRGKMWRGRTVDDRPEPGRLARFFGRWRRH